MRNLSICLAAALLISSPSQAGTMIKFASLAPTGSTYNDILVDLQREWAEISGGNVELRVYADGVAGDESDVVRKMRVNQLQAAIVTAGGLPDIDPDFRAFQVPRMFRDAKEFDHVLTRMRPVLDGLLAKRGFHGLGWADAGWLNFFTRKPIAGPDDLRPQRIFVWSGADRFVKAWSDCGFHPVQLDATQIHTALQSGMIDAINSPPLAALASQWFPKVPNMNTLPWVPLMASFVITDRGWRSLPEALRPKFAEAVERAMMRLRTEVRRDSAKAVEIMRGYGLTVQEAHAEDAALWDAEVQRCFEPLIGPFIDAGLVHRIEATLDDFRANR